MSEYKEASSRYQEYKWSFINYIYKFYKEIRHLIDKNKYVLNVVPILLRLGVSNGSQAFDQIILSLWNRDEKK